MIQRHTEKETLETKKICSNWKKNHIHKPLERDKASKRVFAAPFCTCQQKSNKLDIEYFSDF